jgi:hypothetical protein
MNKCLERANEWHFWNPGATSYARIPRSRIPRYSNSIVFFPIVTSIGYTDKRKDPQMEIVAVFKRIPKNQFTRHTTLFSLRSVP